MTPLVRFVPVCLMTLALAACASVPALDPPPALRDPAAIAASETFTAPLGDFPDTRWWTMWGDPQLDALVDEALAGSPSLDIAAARTRRAQAMVGQARAATLPSIDLDASVGGTRPSRNQGFPDEINGFPVDIIPGQVRSTGRIALGLDFDPDLWGRNRAALAAATSDARAAEVDYAQARLMLVSATVSTYADLHSAFSRHDRAEAQLANARADAELADLRVARGLDNASASHRAREQVARKKGDLLATEAAIALTRNALAELVGEGPDRGLAIARPQMGQAQPLTLPANLPADLIGRRPDVVSARLRAESASARIGVARADFYPSINLAALIGLQAIPIDRLFQTSSLTTQFGPALHLPIFEGGAIAARYEGARAGYDDAVGNYNSALVTAVREVADAVATKRALAAELAAARDAEKAASDALEVARQRFEAGLTDRRAYLTAERTQITAAADVSALVSRDRQADIALAVALGGGFDTRSAPSPDHDHD